MILQEDGRQSSDLDAPCRDLDPLRPVSPRLAEADERSEASEPRQSPTKSVDRRADRSTRASRFIASLREFLAVCPPKADTPLAYISTGCSEEGIRLRHSAAFDVLHSSVYIVVIQPSSVCT